MADKYSIRYLPVAVEDLLSIHDWIASDSPARASFFTDKLEKNAGSLESNPFLGRVPHDARLKSLGYRLLIIESYLVFYLVRGKTIEIHRVIHGSRALEGIL